MGFTVENNECTSTQKKSLLYFLYRAATAEMLLFFTYVLVDVVKRALRPHQNFFVVFLIRSAVSRSSYLTDDLSYQIFSLAFSCIVLLCNINRIIKNDNLNSMLHNAWHETTATETRRTNIKMGQAALQTEIQGQKIHKIGTFATKWGMNWL